MAVSLSGQIRIGLTGSASITALVPTTSIWADQAPEGSSSIPRIIIREGDQNEGNTMTAKNLNRALLEIDCYDYGLEAAKTISLAVKNFLKSYTATFDTINVILGIVPGNTKTVVDRNRPKTAKPVAKSTFRCTVFLEVG